MAKQGSAGSTFIGLLLVEFYAICRYSGYGQHHWLAGPVSTAQ